MYYILQDMFEDDANMPRLMLLDSETDSYKWCYGRESTKTLLSYTNLPAYIPDTSYNDIDGLLRNLENLLSYRKVGFKLLSTQPNLKGVLKYFEDWLIVEELGK